MIMNQGDKANNNKRQNWIDYSQANRFTITRSMITTAITFTVALRD
jgi:hypothetical protein